MFFAKMPNPYEMQFKSQSSLKYYYVYFAEIILRYDVRKYKGWCGNELDLDSC